MTNFTQNLAIPVALPDDLDFETVNAVAEGADLPPREVEIWNSLR
jgi:hypothetical protein